MFGNTNKKITIKSLTLREMKGYKEQYRRPYLTHVDAQTLEMVRSLPAEDQTEASAVAPWINRVLSYSAPVPSLKIPNGWDAKRNSFVLHVQVEMLGMATDYLIAGYTDSTTLDNDTWFVINSITASRIFKVRTHTSEEEYREVFQNDHVLADLYSAALKDKQTVLRPSEIFGGMFMAGLEYLVDDSVVDLRSLLSSSPRLSKRVNNISSVYYATSKRAYHEASTMVEFGSPEDEILSHARGIVLDNPLSNDPFTLAVGVVDGVPPSATFDYDTLRRIEPNIGSVTHRDVYEPSLSSADHLEGDWSNDDITTAIAACLVQAVPALLVDSGISQLHVDYSNSREAARGILVFPENTKGLFDQEVPNERLERFKTRLLKEVMPELTYGNMLDIRFWIKCDVFGETLLSLRVGNEDLKTFVVPTFADAAFSPMTAPQKEVITENHPYVMAKDMSELMAPDTGLEPPPAFVKI